MKDKQSVEDPPAEMARSPLPFELLNRILAQLGPSDASLYNCMLVSRQMHDIAAPHFYHTLHDILRPSHARVFRKATSGKIGVLQRRYLECVKKIDVREDMIHRDLKAPKPNIFSIFPSLRTVRFFGSGNYTDERLTVHLVWPSIRIARLDGKGKGDGDQMCDAPSELIDGSTGETWQDPLDRRPFCSQPRPSHLLAHTTPNHRLFICQTAAAVPRNSGFQYNYPEVHGAETWIITPIACSQLWSEWRYPTRSDVSEQAQRLICIDRLARHFWGYRQSPQLIVGMEAFYHGTNTHDPVNTQAVAHDRLVEIQETFCELLDIRWRNRSEEFESLMPYEDMVKYRAQVRFMSLRQWIDIERVEGEISSEEAESWFLGF